MTIDEESLWDLECALEDIAGYVDDKLAKIALGVYAEDLHGSLQEILETIERMVSE